ncbi:MAG: hypothetical protein FVQ77_06720 [Cytophagales bacterium]|nr:hypothetical protein [Cytophagales bacterium]
MLKLNIKLQPETEEKIRLMLAQHSDKEIFFQGIIKHKINELKNGIVNIKIDLQQFEEKYNLSTEDFYNKFINGELGDEEDFLIWSGIYEMQLRNEKELKKFE